MFKTRTLIGLMVLLPLSSCGDKNSGPEPQSFDAQQPTNSQPQSPPQRSPQQMRNAPPAPQSKGDAPLIPKGAQFTIYCARIDGDLHVERANRTRDEMKQASPMKDWYVIHEQGQSLLYYGYYRAITDTSDAQESARAQKDRLAINQMADQMGNRPFRGALFVPIEAPDPIAPPDWNLANAPGACSLQIAAYKDSPQRKEAAVEAVRAARAQGIEAYYYHGSTTSVVCIGHWADTAYHKTEVKPAKNQNNPDEQFIVPPETGDPAMDKHFDEVAQARGMKVLRPKVEILDPTLKEAMLKYPYHSVNGMYIKHAGEGGKEIFEPSQLVPIPHDKQDDAHAGQSLATQSPAGQSAPGYDPNYRPLIPRQTPPTQPPANPSGTGKLKSIGD